MTQDLIRALACTQVCGLIQDCVLSVKKNRFKIVAIDPSGTLLVLSTGSLETDNVEAVGIPDIKGLKLYLSKMARDASLSITDEYILCKDESLEIKYLTKDPYFVSSYIEDTDDATVEELIGDLKPISVPCYIMDRFKKISGITKASGVTLSVTENGKVTLSAGTENTNGFSLALEDRSRRNSGKSITVRKDILTGIAVQTAAAEKIPMYINDDPTDPSLIVTFLDVAWEISAYEEKE